MKEVEKIFKKIEIKYNDAVFNKEIAIDRCINAGYTVSGIHDNTVFGEKECNKKAILLEMDDVSPMARHQIIDAILSEIRILHSNIAHDIHENNGCHDDMLRWQNGLEKLRTNLYIQTKGE